MNTADRRQRFSRSGIGWVDRVMAVRVPIAPCSVAGRDSRITPGLPTRSFETAERGANDADDARYPKQL